MTAPENIYRMPDDFTGRVRLFPLPNVVMFPHVLQPLHIFEPRYRAMLEEALATDQMVAMAILAPGWEADYEGRPALDPVACLGRIATHNKLENGRYNVLLAGMKRIHLTKELDTDKPFREAMVEIVEDCYPAESTSRRPALEQKLLDSFKRLLPKVPEALEPLERLLAGQVELGTLTDIISYTLDIGLECKLALLREPNVDERARLLIGHLQTARSLTIPGMPKPRGFPPEFSVN